LLQCSTLADERFFHEVQRCSCRRALGESGAAVLDPRFHPPTIDFCNVGGRVYRYAHWRASAPTGAAPLLFFTGIGASIELLAPFLEQLCGRDVVTFDMPGNGGSQQAKWPYRPRTMARVADAILGELGLTGAIEVMGVSWGGMIAQQYAWLYRAKVRKLVLAATTAGIPMFPGRLSALKHMARPRRHVDPGYMRRHAKEIYGGDTGSIPDFEARSLPPTRWGYLLQLLAIWGWTSAWFLPFLRRSSLILMGEDDRLVPTANGRLLRALLPQARLEIVPNGGHLFLLTHREEMAERIAAFLDEA
jgi:poly(3-hydroxyalkanoate) depolymerase